MKYLKYILLVFIVFLTPKVYAAEFNMNSYTSATNGGTKNRYRATEIYNTGMSSIYTFGTRYNGRISDIESYFDYPFEKNTTYRLTYNMSTEDFRNNFDGAYWWDCDDNTQVNPYLSSVIYVSYKKIQVSFKPTENTTCIRMWIKSTSLSNVAITGVSNWNLSNITIYDPDWQNGGSGQGTSTPSPSTPNSNQQIIDNANQNTQDVIENNNSNTQEILDSQKSIDNSLNTNCKNGPLTITSEFISIDNKYLNSSGQEVSDSGAGISQYFIVKGGETYKFTFPSGPPGSSYNMCEYGSDKRLLTNGCRSISSLTNEFTLSNYAQYIRITIYKSWWFSMSLEGPICNNFDKESIDNINDTLNDDSNPSISDNDFLNTFNSIGLNDPLSYLLTLPTQLINKIVTLSSSCTSINLGTLYGVMLTMPCINLENILGSTVWNIIDVIFSVSLLVVIFKNLYDTFSNLLTMGAEKEAKEKFSMPTPMDFLAIILGGDR